MCSDSNYKKEYIRCNVEKWKKGTPHSRNTKKSNCTYEQAEQKYNDEKAKKRYAELLNFSAYLFIIFYIFLRGFQAF